VLDALIEYMICGGSIHFIFDKQLPRYCPNTE
jgi:hypothetical protein